MSWLILKIIALISMTLDHMASTFLTQSFLTSQLGMSIPGSYNWLHYLHYIGRIAFPIYAFGIAQGCTYTKNRKKYLLRLLVFAVISEIPFQLAFDYGQLHFFPLPISNVLFTLLLGAICCFIYDGFREKSVAWVTLFPVACLVLLAEICNSDYGGIGVLCVFLPYLFMGRKWLQLSSLAVMMLVLYYVQPFVLSYSPMSLYAVLTILFSLAGVGLLAIYNGEPGPKGKVSQLLFYAYYPLHLLVFYGLSQWVGPITLTNVP